MNKKIYKVTIFGKVQNVGYRYFTKEIAKSLGITGYVKNLIDGNVETVFTTDKYTYDEFIKRLKKGPTFARVNHIESREINFGEKFNTFTIKY